MREEDEQPAVVNVDNPPDVDVASQSRLARGKGGRSGEGRYDKAHLIGGQVIRSLHNDERFLGRSNHSELIRMSPGKEEGEGGIRTRSRKLVASS